MGPPAPDKWEGKRERGREMGDGHKETKSSSNHLRRKTYFTNYAKGMQGNPGPTGRTTGLYPDKEPRD